MRELSIFVDESGDFGPCAKHSPFYIITMIFHDQTKDISEDISKDNIILYYDNGQKQITRMLNNVLAIIKPIRKKEFR